MHVPTRKVTDAPKELLTNVVNPKCLIQPICKAPNLNIRHPRGFHHKPAWLDGFLHGQSLRRVRQESRAPPNPILNLASRYHVNLVAGPLGVSSHGRGVHGVCAHLLCPVLTGSLRARLAQHAVAKRHVQTAQRSPDLGHNAAQRRGRRNAVPYAGKPSDQAQRLPNGSAAAG